MDSAVEFKPGDLVRVRDREWVVLPEIRDNLLKLRPLGGADDDAALIYLPLELPETASFNLPDPSASGDQVAALLLRDALRLKLRAGAGPFRSFGNLNFEPRAYQLVPLLMALKLDTVRLLIADDVGIGKTIEAGLIAREFLDRGEIKRLAVICPPHLCEQWEQELAGKFAIDAEVVRTGTATRLERGLRPDESVFDAYPWTVVSLDYIKSDRRRSDFLRTCPEFVIVDEAHTCVQSNTDTRHQRYKLLKGLVKSEPRRSMVFLTATPHSGDDSAFHNLLGLLEPKFAHLADTPKDDGRSQLRAELALHFVQRRRADIDEWKDTAKFPVRESKEATYQLTGYWGDLFVEVLAYARTLVQRTEGGTKLQQRMSWWAALALLRCVSSSPAAASLALRTRLQATEEETEKMQIENLNQVARETVMDESGEDSLTIVEGVPAGSMEGVEDADELRRLIARVDDLRGSHDPKLGALICEIHRLVEDGFKPVIFCRWIATAHYVGNELKSLFAASKNMHVVVVTGELASAQRTERVEALEGLGEDIIPVLVATDCLSEGINLQNHFNAVVHYDLTWNPTRHEQREGRADRFGQRSPIVRALMLYGEDNPVDGAVLRVILRKAEKIRRELGVSVPLPEDNSKVVEAIMKAVLLRGDGKHKTTQMELDIGKVGARVDDSWQKASSNNKTTRTVFAQRRLKPDEVKPEWEKAVSALGGSDDVARFIRCSADRLGAALSAHNGYSQLPVTHFPRPLQDRLDAIGFKSSVKISFTQPTPTGVTYVYRNHPLVTTLADYVVEQALEVGNHEVGARSGVVFNKSIKIRTVLYLLRLRSQIQVERRSLDSRATPSKFLLAEECFGVAVRGTVNPEVLIEDDALSLLSLEGGRNVPDEQKTHLIRAALDALPSLESKFESVAHKQAQRLLADHRRVRNASDAKGLQYDVKPVFPVDKIGVYVFMPMLNL